MTPAGMPTVSLAAAFLAGIVSLLSPCVLPLLPVYFSLLAGDAADDTARPLVNVVLFALGFTVVFVALGATASLLGQMLAAGRLWLQKAGGVFIFAMGAFLAGVVPAPLLQRTWRPRWRRFVGPGAAFFLGMAFTLGWTPCIGPILASILLYAGVTATVTQGMALLAAYAAGFMLPFVIIGALWHRCGRLHRVLLPLMPVLQKAAGVVLMLAGVLIYFDLLGKGLGMLF